MLHDEYEIKLKEEKKVAAATTTASKIRKENKKMWRSRDKQFEWMEKQKITASTMAAANT